MFVQTTGGGKNAPKQIHVAHRRSQSELTNLMIEQFTLQKQLEQGVLFLVALKIEMALKKVLKKIVRYQRSFLISWLI